MVARRLVLLAAMALGGCTFPESPLPPGVRKLVVHAVLNPAHRVQVVHISTTAGYNYAGAEVAATTVTITTPDGTVMTAKRDSTPDGNGDFYFGSQFSIDLDAYGVNLAPGATYSLRVVTAKDTVTGTTTIPQAIAVTTQPPVESFDRERDSLHIAWAAVPGARTYEVQVWASFNPESRFRTHSVFASGSITLPGTARTLDDGDVFLEGPTTTVVVLAVDVNYYEYYRMLADPFIGAPPSRLTGGIGVFGSVVPIAYRRLTVH